MKAVFYIYTSLYVFSQDFCGDSHSSRCLWSTKLYSCGNWTFVHSGRGCTSCPRDFLFRSDWLEGNPSPGRFPISCQNWSRTLLDEKKNIFKNQQRNLVPKTVQLIGEVLPSDICVFSLQASALWSLSYYSSPLLLCYLYRKGRDLTCLLCLSNIISCVSCFALSYAIWWSLILAGCEDFLHSSHLKWHFKMLPLVLEFCYFTLSVAQSSWLNQPVEKV